MKTIESTLSNPQASAGKPSFKRLRFGVSALVLAISGLGMAQPVVAAVFNPFINITGKVEFDSLGTPTLPTNATQNGELIRVVGGATTTTSLINDQIVGDDPLSGSLSDIGDGFGIKLHAEGGSKDEPSFMSSLFGDLALSIRNSSAVDTFLVSLKFDFSHLVAAPETKTIKGNGDFAQSIVQLHKKDNSELLFSKLISDTVFGNEARPASAPDQNTASGYGGKLVDSGSRLLTFILHPGELLELGDDSPELTLFGGADPGAFFLADTSAFLSVAEVTRQTTNTVPEPETLLLMAIGLLSFGLSKRRASTC
ncbi:PEP-CTERM sorting domain-containing protein [Methylomonas sp. CM2]|uniref:PEP-CTERM sorting domain-containing protein n=1 Tax=Methylomonas sp. CM2 TaxID=3417647 RepID=UPI003CFBA774